MKKSLNNDVTTCTHKHADYVLHVRFSYQAVGGRETLIEA